MIEANPCKDTESIVEVAKKLRENLIRYIYIVDDEGKPVGVVSILDINNRIVAEGKDPNGITAKDVMTSPVQSFDEEEDESKAYRECMEKEIVTCPVTSDGKLIGMVTIDELLRKITHYKN
tara:strand:+ start:1056 stop:1418 length:363 start_codon:yes stop_codon:yes gene_type:complete